MSGSNRLPTVFILRQAMDVIRREALKFDIETGGILIGSRSPDGAILVTHATPPGPNAVHNAVYFKRDVAYQQAALNSLHRRYGVQYLGEWHKHPRNLPVPSGGDFQGVCDLLHDPDYGVNDLLFPIIICEPDLGFQIHPFYISSSNIEATFQSMQWHELPLSVDVDHVFEKDQANYGACASLQTSAANNVGRSAEPVSSAKVTAGLWALIENTIPFFRRSLGVDTIDENDSAEETAETPRLENEGLQRQWYETDEGRLRLLHEQKLLNSFGLCSQPFTIGDRCLCFAFPRGGGREIVVICAANHPEHPPQFLIRACFGGKHRPLDSWPWDSHTSFLAEAIVQMLGPIVSIEQDATRGTL